MHTRIITQLLVLSVIATGHSSSTMQNFFEANYGNTLITLQHRLGIRVDFTVGRGIRDGNASSNVRFSNFSFDRCMKLRDTGELSPR